MIKYLLDTNIMLEGLQNQEKSEEIKYVITRNPGTDPVITDSSIHSIGIVVFKLREYELSNDFGLNVFAISRKDGNKRNW
ncbi:MAG: hypothetical protein QXO15_12535 [Nitrososphaerota archaeon]